MNRESTTITVVSLISILLLCIIGLLLYFIYRMDASKITPSEKIPVSTPTPQVVTPTQTPIPTSVSVPTLQPTLKPISVPTNLPVTSDIELVRTAMAKKHNKPVADTEISISKNNGTHIWGSVKFAGDMGGGWFLAAKQSGNWIIVDDGNGTIECSVIAPYNFPVDMVPECYNSVTDQIIKR